MSGNLQQPKKTLSQQRLENWDQYKKQQRNKYSKQPSQEQITKTTQELIKSWQEEHGDSEDSAHQFWQHLTRELYKQGGKKAVLAGIDALKKAGSVDNAEVMEEELTRLSQ